MKKSKRIVVVILCIIMCISPTVLMVSASEAACEHPTWIAHTSTAANRYFRCDPTESICPGYMYVGCLCTCTTCGHQEIRTVYEPHTTHTYEAKPQGDGIYIFKCSRCGYISSAEPI